MKCNHPKTVDEFLRVVGRDRFQAETGYSPQIVSRAVSDGLMPSRWYLKVRAWCELHGIETPEHLFRMDQSKPIVCPSNSGAGQ